MGRDGEGWQLWDGMWDGDGGIERWLLRLQGKANNLIPHSLPRSTAKASESALFSANAPADRLVQSRMISFPASLPEGHSGRPTFRNLRPIGFSPLFLCLRHSAPSALCLLAHSCGPALLSLLAIIPPVLLSSCPPALSCSRGPTKPITHHYSCICG